MPIDLSPGWENRILQGLGIKNPSPNARQSLDIWATQEGGAGIANNAWFNPFNTTLQEPGSTAINSVGVQAYTSEAQGIQATISTLQGGYYTSIVGDLSSGASPQQTGHDILASPWGTSTWGTSVAPGVASSNNQSSGGNWFTNGLNTILGIPGDVGSAADNLGKNIGRGINSSVQQGVSNAAGGLVTGIIDTLNLKKWGVIILISIAIVLLVLELFHQGTTVQVANKKSIAGAV